MNFELLDRLTEMLQKNELEEAIVIAENKLKEIPKTEFHKILNRNLFHLKFELANYLKEFTDSASKYYKKGNKKINFFSRIFGNKKNEKKSKELKSIYCEMNGFTINYDRWFIDFFAFDFFQEINLEDLDWLCDYEFDMEKSMTISGFEDLQIAFQNYMENETLKDENLKKSMEICELLIILRLQELFKFTFNENKNESWTKLPTLIDAHDYEMIYKVGN